jgi:hypothetical protein
MSPPDYAQMSTEELLQSFIETAKRTGCLFGPDKGKLRQTPDRQVRVQKMQAIGAELRRRSPIEELRKLFTDNDPDVRGWAGPQFISVDPDWAGATITGLFHGLSTRQVLAWRDRILRGAPRHPALGDMTVEQLLERFVDACERCYGSTRFLTEEQSGGTNMSAYNKVSGEPYAVAKELNARGALNALVPLLDHPFVTVRQKAAGYCLPVAADKALATLKAIDTKSISKESLEASWTLSEWARGMYRTFPYY